MPVVAKIFVLKCYVTRPQYEKIKQDAHARGHSSISDYVRTVIVGTSMVIERTVIENSKILKELQQHIKDEFKS